MKNKTKQSAFQKVRMVSFHGFQTHIFNLEHTVAQIYRVPYTPLIHVCLLQHSIIS